MFAVMQGQRSRGVQPARRSFIHPGDQPCLTTDGCRTNTVQIHCIVWLWQWDDDLCLHIR